MKNKIITEHTLEVIGLANEEGGLIVVRPWWETYQSWPRAQSVKRLSWAKDPSDKEGNPEEH